MSFEDFHDYSGNRLNPNVDPRFCVRKQRQEQPGKEPEFYIRDPSTDTLDGYQSGDPVIEGLCALCMASITILREQQEFKTTVDGPGVASISQDCILQRYV